MNAAQIVVGILMLLFSIVIVAVVLFQQGRAKGISGAIAGGADTFFDKTKARTIDNILEKVTKYIAFIFFLLTLASTAIVVFGK